MRTCCHLNFWRAFNHDDVANTDIHMWPVVVLYCGRFLQRSRRKHSVRLCGLGWETDQKQQKASRTSDDHFIFLVFRLYIALGSGAQLLPEHRQELSRLGWYSATIIGSWIFRQPGKCCELLTLQIKWNQINQVDSLSKWVFLIFYRRYWTVCVRTLSCTQSLSENTSLILPRSSAVRSATTPVDRVEIIPLTSVNNRLAAPRA